MDGFRDIDQLHAETQDALVTFLRVELELARTLLAVANATSGVKREPTRAKVRASLQIVRQFQGRIKDAQAWAEIHKAVDRLDRELHES